MSARGRPRRRGRVYRNVSSFRAHARAYAAFMRSVRRSMDFKKNRVDVKKSLDSLIGGLPEDEVDDDKHNMDPLQYVQVKTEIKEEPCNVITVKEELKDEVTTEEYEVQPEQVNDSPIQSPTTDRSEDRLKCEVCGKLLSHRASLINHVRTHTGEKPFKCETCGKVFSVCGQLTRHHRTHTGEKPFKCDICGKEYTQKEHVVTHQRTHTGEKPFKCEVCGKAFYARGHLVTHRRIHTGEKPFVCEVCGKAFPWKGPLSAHYRTHFHQKPSEYAIIGEGSAQSATYLPAATVIGLSNADLT